MVFVDQVQDKPSTENWHNMHIIGDCHNFNFEKFSRSSLCKEKNYKDRIMAYTAKPKIHYQL